MKIKTFMAAMTALSVILAATPVMANSKMLPPQYLSVKDWQKCLSTKAEGDAQSVCLPSKQPTHCSPHSWDELINMTEIPHC